MNKIEFDRTKQQYDSFDRFHVMSTYGEVRMALFESGEFLLLRRAVDPVLRGNPLKFRGTDTGLSVWLPGDKGMPAMRTAEGEPVPAAWLRGTGQYMVVDHTTKRVSALASWGAEDCPKARCGHALAGRGTLFIPGPGTPNMYGGTITLSKPHTWTSEERALAKQLRLHACAEAALMGDAGNYWAERRLIDFSAANWWDATTHTTQTVVCIAKFGVHPKRSTEKHDYLVLA